MTWEICLQPNIPRNNLLFQFLPTPAVHVGSTWFTLILYMVEIDDESQNALLPFRLSSSIKINNWEMLKWSNSSFASVHADDFIIWYRMKYDRITWHSTLIAKGKRKVYEMRRKSFQTKDDFPSLGSCHGRKCIILWFHDFILRNSTPLESLKLVSLPNPFNVSFEHYIK